MSGFIADIDVTHPNGDAVHIDELDTVIQEFKAQVLDSLPNLDSVVSATPAAIDQLVDNDFDSSVGVVRENGVEVAKITGGTFTGPVYDPGIPPTESDQLVNRAYVEQAIQDALDQLP